MSQALLADELSEVDLRSLIETGNALAASIDLGNLLDGILLKAGQLTDSADGCILLARECKQQLYFAAAMGEHAETLLSTRGEFSQDSVPVHGSKAGVVFLSGVPQDFSDIQQDPEHYKAVDRQTGKQTQTMVCAPLTVQGETIGVMQVLNKRNARYTHRDVKLLQHLAVQAAIAIRNARLFQSIIAHMGLYGSPETRKGMADLSKHLRAPMTTERLTVLFADMRGFTQLCQRINSPQEVQLRLDEFLGMLAREVLTHGGVVNKFLGDGVLALFREGDHAQRAVECALSMLEAFKPIRERWDETVAADLEFLDLGVGIVTDSVMIGTIGSDRVRDFTVIGTPVILAAAFEKLARGGRRIIIDQPTYTEVRELVDVENLPRFVLRKNDQDTGVPYKQFNVQGRKPKFWTKVFISHNHNDRSFVTSQLVKPLVSHGIDSWYSGTGIAGGEAWVRSIHEGLKECQWFVVIVSKHSTNAEWVKREIEIAAADKRLSERIIPIVLDDTVLENVHPHLNHLHALNAQDAPPIDVQLSNAIRQRNND